MSYINRSVCRLTSLPSKVPRFTHPEPSSLAIHPLHTNHLQWTLPQTPKSSARNNSWLCPACLALCPHFLKHGASNRSPCTPPRCLLSSLPRAKPRYALPPHLTFPARWCLPFPTAPQGALKIGHSLPPVIDRDAPTEPSVFSFSPADDEGVWPQFHIARRVQ